MKTSENPLISVVLPMYNAEEYIKEAIYSILNQTYDNIEVIVVNDCSTDDSYNIVKNISDNRVKLLNNKLNSKISASLNKGIESSQGEFIARMDADDISLPDRLEKQLKFLKENPEIDFVGTGIRKFGAISEELYNPVDPNLIKDTILTGNPFAHPTMMFRSKLKNHIKYKDDFATAEDIELWSRLLKSDYKGSNIKEILLLYRVSGNQTMYVKNKDNKVIENTKQKELSREIKRQNIQFSYPEGFKYKNVTKYENLILQNHPIGSIGDLNHLAKFIIELDNLRSFEFYSKKAYVNIYFYKILDYIKLKGVRNSVLLLAKWNVMRLILRKM